MTAKNRYATPAAFRRALTDRLRMVAGDGLWTLPQLQRQVTYDRLLERLYVVDDSWIVKGATALLARGLGVRGSLDIDVYRSAAREVAEADVRRAAALDVGDWFRFEAGGGASIAGNATRIPVTSVIGTTSWCEFHVDLVGGDIRMTGRPDDVAPLVRGAIPEVQQRGYRTYPLVDHVADKVAATYARYGAAAIPSTRYRDLVDLVSIVSGASVDASGQRAALESEFNRRGMTLPERFNVPDRRLWEPGYAAEAKRSLLGVGRTLDSALAIVRAFIDPVLDGSAIGAWDSATATWRS